MIQRDNYPLVSNSTSTLCAVFASYANLLVLSMLFALLAAPGALAAGTGDSSSVSDPHAHHKNMLSNKSVTSTLHDYVMPDIRLIDSHGKITSLDQELSAQTPVMLNFIFTTCTTICPVLTATLAQVQRNLGSERDQVKMISITIDPEHDTPARLDIYAKRFHAGDQWRFLTGDRDGIVAVQKAFNAYHGSKMNHKPITFLRADANAQWTRIEGIASATAIINQYRQLIEN